ncbi:DUF1642 domain-containing protein [Lacticaseibacillus paracasei]|uniref:DUF1642 domain-containing protein n=1 Tax=Lacticaseibacillus paracasei TaxID=1597 RepID=UPI0022239404|nr:DUF1642 domain-containing protein [Lacticaseibacillus paracasei]UYX01554.1 DUF1642 domain-containing protein [Lacticaseibacillus paracasei subsp. tolerans]UYX01610.1 DUF1642 domain-containing protein [Lacticaseibacillus paracasei subsp. tolerans]UYX04593.1 DUF1642 domain-containing protein [Lacticaseibacillus paracasei subsp. tolerans]
MSEEKLYAVKNAKGIYLSYSDDKHYHWREGWREGEIAATTSQRIAHDLCTDHGGHVVTLIEEPEKVVLTEEQAEIVDDAHGYYIPASYISRNYSDEELLMNAYVNGYTVAKEKKYLVYKELGGNQKHEQFAQAYRSSVYPGTVSWILTNEVTNRSFAQFTKSEIEHYGLQDCEKEEVTDDAD